MSLSPLNIDLKEAAICLHFHYLFCHEIYRNVHSVRVMGCTTFPLCHESEDECLIQLPSVHFSVPRLEMMEQGSYCSLCECDTINSLPMSTAYLLAS